MESIILNCIVNPLFEGGVYILFLLDKHNGFVQAMTTIVLVWVTIKSLREAANTRKDNRLPIIKLEMNGPYNYGTPGQGMHFKVSNIGYGLAIDVKLSFVFNDMEIIDFGNLKVDDEQSTSISISNEKLEEMKKATKLFDVLVVSYEDIFGRKATTFGSMVNENEGTRHNWPHLVISKWRVGLPE